ncbi:DUF424 family protein [Candidatus Woesearchaeota archaeon]|nr:DUF424 family protein [Candidatus Woesearchaeota archaeon]
MIVKKHESKGRLVLAVCDSKILGKKIEDNKKILDLGSEFYKGREISDEELSELMKKSYIVNAVGTEAVNFLKQENYLSEKEVMFVLDVPYVQVVFEH